MAQQPRF